MNYGLLLWGMLKGTGQYLKFSFWLNFIYHVKCAYKFTHTKENSEILSENEEVIIFLLSMNKVGMRIICIHDMLLFKTLEHL